MQALTPTIQPPELDCTQMEKMQKDANKGSQLKANAAALTLKV